MTKYLATFKVPVTFYLSKQQIDEAYRVINLKFLGREKFKSLKEPASREHQEAAHAANRHYSVMLEVGMKEDGELELIEARRK